MGACNFDRTFEGRRVNIIFGEAVAEKFSEYFDAGVSFAEALKNALEDVNPMEIGTDKYREAARVADFLYLKFGKIINSFPASLFLKLVENASGNPEVAAYYREQLRSAELDITEDGVEIATLYKTYSGPTAVAEFLTDLAALRFDNEFQKEYALSQEDDLTAAFNIYDKQKPEFEDRVEDIIDLFRDRYGIDITVLDEEEYYRVTGDKNRASSGAYKDGKIYLNKSKFTRDTVIEEMLHALVAMVDKSDPALIDDLLDFALKNGYAEKHEQHKKQYGDEDMAKNETVTAFLKDNIDVEDKPGLLKRILRKIAEFIYNLFGVPYRFALFTADELSGGITKMKIADILKRINDAGYISLANVKSYHAPLFQTGDGYDTRAEVFSALLSSGIRIDIDALFRGDELLKHFEALLRQVKNKKDPIVHTSITEMFPDMFKEMEQLVKGFDAIKRVMIPVVNAAVQTEALPVITVLSGADAMVSGAEQVIAAFDALEKDPDTALSKYFPSVSLDKLLPDGSYEEMRPDTMDRLFRHVMDNVGLDTLRGLMYALSRNAKLLDEMLHEVDDAFSVDDPRVDVEGTKKKFKELLSSLKARSEEAYSKLLALLIETSATIIRDDNLDEDKQLMEYIRSSDDPEAELVLHHTGADVIVSGMDWSSSLFRIYDLFMHIHDIFAEGLIVEDTDEAGQQITKDIAFFSAVMAWFHSGINPERIRTEGFPEGLSSNDFINLRNASLVRLWNTYKLGTTADLLKEINKSLIGDPDLKVNVMRALSTDNESAEPVQVFDAINNALLVSLKESVAKADEEGKRFKVWKIDDAKTQEAVRYIYSGIAKEVRSVQTKISQELDGLSPEVQLSSLRTPSRYTILKMLSRDQAWGDSLTSENMEHRYTGFRIMSKLLSGLLKKSESLWSRLRPHLLNKDAVNRHLNRMFTGKLLRGNLEGDYMNKRIRELMVKYGISSSSSEELNKKIVSSSYSVIDSKGVTHGYLYDLVVELSSVQLEILNLEKQIKSLPDGNKRAKAVEQHRRLTRVVETLTGELKYEDGEKYLNDRQKRIVSGILNALHKDTGSYDKVIKSVLNKRVYLTAPFRNYDSRTSYASKMTKYLERMKMAYDELNNYRRTYKAKHIDEIDSDAGLNVLAKMVSYYFEMLSDELLWHEDIIGFSKAYYDLFGVDRFRNPDGSFDTEKIKQSLKGDMLYAYYMASLNAMIGLIDKLSLNVPVLRDVTEFNAMLREIARMKTDLLRDIVTGFKEVDDYKKKRIQKAIEYHSIYYKFFKEETMWLRYLNDVFEDFGTGVFAIEGEPLPIAAYIPALKRQFGQMKHRWVIDRASGEPLYNRYRKELIALLKEVGVDLSVYNYDIMSPHGAAEFRENAVKEIKKAVREYKGDIDITMTTVDRDMSSGHIDSTTERKYTVKDKDELLQRVDELLGVLLPEETTDINLYIHALENSELSNELTDILITELADFLGKIEGNEEEGFYIGLLSILDILTEEVLPLNTERFKKHLKDKGYDEVKTAELLGGLANIRSFIEKNKDNYKSSVFSNKVTLHASDEVNAPNYDMETAVMVKEVFSKYTKGKHIPGFYIERSPRDEHTTPVIPGITAEPAGRNTLAPAVFKVGSFYKNVGEMLADRAGAGWSLSRGWIFRHFFGGSRYQFMKLKDMAKSLGLTLSDNAMDSLLKGLVDYVTGEKISAEEVERLFKTAGFEVKKEVISMIHSLPEAAALVYGQMVKGRSIEDEVKSLKNFVNSIEKDSAIDRSLKDYFLYSVLAKGNEVNRSALRELLSYSNIVSNHEQYGLVIDESNPFYNPEFFENSADLKMIADFTELYIEFQRRLVPEYLSLGFSLPAYFTDMVNSMYRSDPGYKAGLIYKATQYMKGSLKGSVVDDIEKYISLMRSGAQDKYEGAFHDVSLLFYGIQNTPFEEQSRDFLRIMFLFSRFASEFAHLNENKTILQVLYNILNSQPNISVLRHEGGVSLGTAGVVASGTDNSVSEVVRLSLENQAVGFKKSKSPVADYVGEFLSKAFYLMNYFLAWEGPIVNALGGIAYGIIYHASHTALNRNIKLPLKSIKQAGKFIKELPMAALSYLAPYALAGVNNARANVSMRWFPKTVDLYGLLMPDNEFMKFSRILDNIATLNFTREGGWRKLANKMLDQRTFTFIKDGGETLINHLVFHAMLTTYPLYKDGDTEVFFYDVYDIDEDGNLVELQKPKRGFEITIDKHGVRMGKDLLQWLNDVLLKMGYATRYTTGTNKTIAKYNRFSRYWLAYKDWIIVDLNAMFGSLASVGPKGEVHIGSIRHFFKIFKTIFSLMAVQVRKPASALDKEVELHHIKKALKVLLKKDLFVNTLAQTAATGTRVAVQSYIISKLLTIVGLLGTSIISTLLLSEDDECEEETVDCLRDKLDAMLQYDFGEAGGTGVRSLNMTRAVAIRRLLIKHHEELMNEYQSIKHTGDATRLSDLSRNILLTKIQISTMDRFINQMGSIREKTSSEINKIVSDREMSEEKKIRELKKIKSRYLVERKRLVEQSNEHYLKTIATFMTMVSHNLPKYKKIEEQLSSEILDVDHFEKVNDAAVQYIANKSGSLAASDEALYEYGLTDQSVISEARKYAWLLRGTEEMSGVMGMATDIIFGTKSAARTIDNLITPAPYTVSYTIGDLTLASYNILKEGLTGEPSTDNYVSRTDLVKHNVKGETLLSKATKNFARGLYNSMFSNTLYQQLKSAKVGIGVDMASKEEMEKIKEIIEQTSFYSTAPVKSFKELKEEVSDTDTDDIP